MSSISVRFEKKQNSEVLRNAVKFALDEEDSCLLLDNGEKMVIDWFSIYPDCIAIAETAMAMDDIETANDRLCDILINMIPDAAFSSHAVYLARSTGYEKAFHIDYKNGIKSGFDVEGIPWTCCPECDESIIGCTDEEYEPGKTYRCSCGYEYDPVDNPDCWGIKVYKSFSIADIPEVKVDRPTKGSKEESQGQLVQIEFPDKTFVTTGLSVEEENWIREQIESRGGKLKRKFVVSLNYLIYNPDYDHETVKYTRAKEQIEKGKPVQIITFEQFKNSL